MITKQILKYFCIVNAVTIISCCVALYISGLFSTPDSKYASQWTSQWTDIDEICEFPIRYDNLNVMPGYTLPITINSEWVCNLYRGVKQLKGRQLTLLVCNSQYLDITINWLAHSVLYAFHPVSRILIIAFDSLTYHVLHSKGFHSVYILPEDVVDSSTKQGHSHIWVTRMTIVRLLNYWNYSVLEFDGDAIMMRNIQPLLDKFANSDIIASPGTFPTNLTKKWKAPTLCMGVILIKCSPAIDQLWLKFKTLDVGLKVDDQLRMNMALDRMGMKWNRMNDGYYEGHTTSGNTTLTVTIIPKSLFCRRGCNSELLKQYYVWHPYFRKITMSKRTKMTLDHVWLLNDNWNASLRDSTLKTEQWLKNITKPKSD